MTARLAGSMVVCAVAAQLVASPGAANAAVPAPLVSSSMSSSDGSTVTTGMTLTVAFNRAPALASPYSLTLTDGSDVGTLSAAAGNLTVVASGSNVVFTVAGAPAMSGASLSLSAPLEVLSAAGSRWPTPRYVSCLSSKTFRHLKAGGYLLYARAVGPGGADGTPARYRFTPS